MSDDMKKELIVLTYGAPIRGGYKLGEEFVYSCEIPICAYIDVETNTLNKIADEKYLTWKIPKEKYLASDWVFDIEDEHIYRVLVEVDENSVLYELKDVICETSDERLSKILDNLKSKITLEYDGNKFLLNRKAGAFICKCKIKDSECIVKLRLDEKYGDSAYQALKIWDKISRNLSRTDKKTRKFIVKKLLEKANSWNKEKITKRIFMEKIKLCFIDVTESMYSFYYDDGELFAGHAICANGTLEDGLEYASLEG